MKDNDSATATGTIAVGGFGLAALGVLTFSFTLPSTEFALRGLDPYLIGVGRNGAAAVLAAIALLATHPRLTRRHRANPPRQPGAAAERWLPEARQVPALLAVAAGVVFGFPMLSTLALDHGSSSAHAAVVVALLPAATAVAAVVRAGERPSPAFWAASGAGLVCVTTFALVRAGGRVTASDLLLFGALLAAAIGYCEGGRLAREMAGWRVISWGLVLSAPVSLPATGWLLATTHPRWTVDSVAGFAYASVFSAFLGFFAWYAGLGRAGIARASQVQLAQPVMTLLWAGLLLGESITAATGLTAVAVLVCVALTQRTRITQRAPLPEAPAPVRSGASRG
ncbi:DMT family transporter [Actinomadura logoneensis]|uniref:DMT family transporter n=1 Tax=Actinomadura logoneensis TaxID=2293572 RepID=A0A372JKA4_9ACTN|nr:DMT family transporter [Actinomadura logoneensis]RFU40274.1 DMT family transporter [Actinomadura logoneensis]